LGHTQIDGGNSVEIVHIFQASLFAAKDASIVPSHTLDYTIYSIHNDCQERKDAAPFLIIINSEEGEAKGNKKR
jgi:hypothetical protein